MTVGINHVSVVRREMDVLSVGVVVGGVCGEGRGGRTVSVGDWPDFLLHTSPSVSLAVSNIIRSFPTSCVGSSTTSRSSVVKLKEKKCLGHSWRCHHLSLIVKMSRRLMHLLIIKYVNYFTHMCAPSVFFSCCVLPTIHFL